MEISQMTKNVTLTWDLPIIKESGGPLPPTEIDFTLIELDAGAGFGELIQILPTDAQSAFVPDMDPGDWSFRVTVIDTRGVGGVPHVEAFTVVDESPPGTVTNVVVTQS